MKSKSQGVFGEDLVPTVNILKIFYQKENKSIKSKTKTLHIRFSNKVSSIKIFKCEQDVLLCSAVIIVIEVSVLQLFNLFLSVGWIQLKNILKVQLQALGQWNTDYVQIMLSVSHFNDRFIFFPYFAHRIS